jgi:hypothetical protein
LTTPKSTERAGTLAPSTPIVDRLLADIHMRQKTISDLLSDIDANSPADLRAVHMREQIT